MNDQTRSLWVDEGNKQTELKQRFHGNRTVQNQKKEGHNGTKVKTSKEPRANYPN